MSSFTTCFMLFVLAFVAVVSALPIELSRRDVFVPTILTPQAGTVWTIGSEQNVTWSTADAPAQITNGQGEIVIRRNGLMDLEHPLATNFSILDGVHTITVPNVEPGDGWSIVLFGDSGNNSPDFSIVAASA